MLPILNPPSSSLPIPSLWVVSELERFEEQQAARDAGDEEAQMLDRDFVEMLEYGMPPACGWGNSERNFWLLEGVPGREAVPFPTMKHQE